MITLRARLTVAVFVLALLLVLDAALFNFPQLAPLIAGMCGAMLFALVLVISWELGTPDTPRATPHAGNHSPADPDQPHKE